MPDDSNPNTLASGIRLLCLDVDGVLTDGSINIDNQGNESKRFYVRDGFGIRLWKSMDRHIAIITGRSSKALTHRANEIGIECLVQGSKDKVNDLQRITAELGVTLEQTAFVGDDWPDLAAMKLVGYPIAVFDAEPDICDVARYITDRPGGHGAVRDAVEHLLDAQDLLSIARKRYD